MIKKIRTSKLTRFIAFYLAIMMFVEMTQPMRMYALTGGPTQPEFDSFTPIGTSDMVDLSSGDFNYNIPIMDVGGYPINLAYNSGVTMDQEASWVGLGWDLNVGQIARQVRGLPDDFDGDLMTYENNMKENITVGSNVNVFFSGFGVGENLKASIGLGIKYNNYDGFGSSINGGLTYQIAENLSVGMNMESSASDGVSVSPSVSFDKKFSNEKSGETNLGANAGVSYNSRKGLESMTMSFKAKKQLQWKNKEGEKGNINIDPNISGSVSFVDASYTPTKRVGMLSKNFVFNLNLEAEIWGLEPGVKFTGYCNTQGIKSSEKNKKEKAYGFENTYNAGNSDILDFNREKDRTVTRNTVTLPITNNTYDLYNIQGQGISGMYRPYKSQVGYVYDNSMRDDSFGGQLGLEVGAGGGFHWGYDASITLGKSRTSVWESENPAIYRFKENTNNNPEYEKVFFKNIGGFHVDHEFVETPSGNNLKKKIGNYDALKLELGGDRFARTTKLNYYGSNGAEIANTGVIKRIDRLKRNQSIQKLTRKEAQKYGFKTQFSPYSLAGKHDHHTSEVRITKEGGERYIYGRAAYNLIKREVTFDVSDKDHQYSNVDCENGLVNYSGKDNSTGNKRDGDQYFNRVTTPAYAHSYLLTAVVSPDYQDIDDNGPSDNDLGTYTSFTYDNKTKDNPYKWRVPYLKNTANFDEGFRSSRKDNKGNYQYGEKELLFIKKIETKTHVAIFHISERRDGYGVKDENGGLDTASKTYKLNKISLYSKPEYLANAANAVPIKEAHFVYDYSLCKGVHNNSKAAAQGPEELDNQGGKLTLKSVYFTYKNSKMGKYAPYKFEYDANNNPDYNMKAYDTWGNYKPVEENVGCGTMDSLSNAEYPYVDQSNEVEANKNASAWLLKTISMPSGGKIQLDFESDDYAHVQNKDVMQMFKVVGAGSSPLSSAAQLDNKTLYSGSSISNHIYVELDNSEDISAADFFNRYVKQLIGSPVYFRFLTNMADPNPLPGMGGTDKYDYVTGYLKIDKTQSCRVFENNGKKYASIPVELSRQGDGLSPNRPVHPISKAGWFFGRQNLNRLVYSMHNEEDTNNVKGIVMELIGQVKVIFDIFKSPNGKLRENEIASRFIAGKSWIRLMHPDQEKVGGGSRVKQIKMLDQWNVMTDHSSEEIYGQFYGQEYSYDTEEGKTSGVATYEPLGSKENPFVEPFYDNNKPDLVLGPETDNYVEKPLGESFFPAPKITYGRVTVKNLDRAKSVNNQAYVVKKHATGKVVTEFFTSKDYPTIVDYTILSAHYDKTNMLSSLLKLTAKDHLTMSQGYMVHTNDMDGKKKSEKVYGEGQDGMISGVEYKYKEVNDGQTTGLTANQVNNFGKLNNEVMTIDSKGAIKKGLVGVDYDMVNDFRKIESITETPGVHLNFAAIPITLYILIVPIPIPSYSKHESVLKTAVTTKVMHTTGILSETIAYDAGSKVSTKNLAWDAETGDVLLTETVNEYNDKYYNFNFPAYWNYNGMRQAAKNIGLQWDIHNYGSSETEYQLKGAITEDNYLIDGDELWLSGVEDSETSEPGMKTEKKAWVVKVTGNRFKLIDSKGLLINKKAFKEGTMKIIRSGHRNLQMDKMASVTSMINPFILSGDVWKSQIDNTLYSAANYSDYKIVNASAIEYSDIWPGQCECDLPKMQYTGSGANRTLAFEYESTTNQNDDPDDIRDRSFNPYLYNILGNWRASKSYAYLTGRNYGTNPTPRQNGFFNNFDPFYVFNNSKWGIVAPGNGFEKWTYASEVTQFNPYGQEVENKDALERYSSALHGYNNRFPVAVASNTMYKELAFDGFEDYDFSSCTNSAHFNFKEALKQNEIVVTNKQAHTGKRSLRVEAGKRSVIKKQLVSCEAQNQAPKQNNTKKKVNTRIAKLVKK